MQDAAILMELIRIQADIVKSGFDLVAVMERVALEAQRLTGAHGAAVELVEGDDMVYRAACGIAHRQLGLRLARSASLSGLCVEQDTILTCADTQNDPRVDRLACQRIGLRSMLVVPLRHEAHAVGVLKVMSPEVAAFGPEQAEVLRLISSLIASAMFQAARHASDALYHRATHDELTGLANRALFYDRLRQRLDAAACHGQGLALLNLDMDALKAINDRFGHRAGDTAIRAFAHWLRDSCRAADVVARVGGDEFGVILTGVCTRAEARAVCARLQQTPPSCDYDGQVLALGASLGLALYPEDGQTLEALLDSADRAMYRDKRGHKLRTRHVASRR